MPESCDAPPVGPTVELPQTSEPVGPTVELPQTSEPVVLVLEDLPIPRSPVEIDLEIRRAVRRLAERELEIGRLALRLISRQGWRRLGYASREQYAVDRVGLSVSSLEHRVTLYRRARAVPAMREALLAGEVGYEATMQIGRIEGLRPNEIEAWVGRAKRRTVLALRAEVKAVLLLRTLDPVVSKAPPDEAVLAEAEELERKVLSGELYRSLFDGKVDPQTSVTLLAGSGSEIRMTVPAELRAHFERVEHQFHRVAGGRVSFVAFMCFSFWQAWLPVFEHTENQKWSELYHRDRHRCSSPVCDRTDVTPHHLKFQAHGGGDELENMGAFCSWCHLQGIHEARSRRPARAENESSVGSEPKARSRKREGRISAEPPASNIRWKIGRNPIMEIEGRDVIARS